jgi:2-C-methyl-D-erythritol 4-phosphate cytidylyltransferase
MGLTMIKKAVAVIPAAGVGQRMGQNVSKQYLCLGGVPILIHTLRKFDQSPSVKAVYLTCPEGDLQYIEKELLPQHGIVKVEEVVAGGEKRQDSVRIGLSFVDDDTDVVVIHDGVRPFVSVDLIERTILEADEMGAVCAGVPVKDTVKVTCDGGWVRRTLDRNTLWLVQTPQTFRREIIQRAHQEAYNERFYGTDDAMLVERMGLPVRMIHGSYENIKMTTPEDLAFGEILIGKDEQS